MRNVKISRRYAEALFAAASETAVIDEVIDDANNLLQLAEKLELFDQLIHDVLISPESKKEIFQSILAEKVNPLTITFLQLLSEKQRERALIAILETFLEIVDLKAGRISVHVTSAIEMTDSQKADLIARLSGFSGKSVRLKINIDTSIKGGFIAKLGDTIFDASVATQLQRLKEKLARG